MSWPTASRGGSDGRPRLCTGTACTGCSGRAAAPRLAAITSGGAIPDTADYDVVLEPDGTVVGSVNEDFAIESMAGEIFLLGNASWRIRRIEAGRVRVVDAHGAPPSVPFWLGEAPARTPELSLAVAGLRDDIAERLGDRPALEAWLTAETGVDPDGAAQAADYIAETIGALGCVPTQETIIAERFFDESGGMQVVLHTPFGARINRAWGLALRKRFCLTFDFELQAAATDDGIVLSLSQQHSFPLDSLFGFVRTRTAEEDVVQAMLATPLFPTRWRWNASRSLALLRHSGGRRVPMPIQRMRAEDLLGAVFPEQVGCQDNRMGNIEPPDHPLVTETIRNCLHEAMDIDGLRTGGWGRLRSGIDSRRRGRDDHAVGDVARDPQLQSLHLPGRRTARGTPGARGGPAAHRPRPCPRHRRARRGRDRRGRRPGLAGRPERRRAARSSAHGRPAAGGRGEHLRRAGVRPRADRRGPRRGRLVGRSGRTPAPRVRAAAERAALVAEALPGARFEPAPAGGARAAVDIGRW